MIILTRYYSPFGVHGDLEIEGHNFSTLELPWRGNKQGESCIPEGHYFLQMRDSPVVQRTSGAGEGWEVMDVPGRTYIMFHVGNWIKNSEGCILIGREKNIVDNGLFISNSQDAFDEFMDITDGKMEWEIMIKPFVVEWP